MNRTWVIVQSHYPKGSSKLHEDIGSDLFTQETAEKRARMLQSGTIRFGYRAREATPDELSRLQEIEARRAETAHLWTRTEV